MISEATLCGYVLEEVLARLLHVAMPGHHYRRDLAFGAHVSSRNWNRKTSLAHAQLRFSRIFLSSSWGCAHAPPCA